MTALDERVQRSARVGLVKQVGPSIRNRPQSPPGLQEAAVEEIMALYRQTRRSIEEYVEHPFISRVVPCPGDCGGVVHTKSGRDTRQKRGDTYRLVTWCDPCAAARTKVSPTIPYADPAAMFPPECGTYRGYRRHLRLHEPVCDSCRAACAARQRSSWPSRQKTAA